MQSKVDLRIKNLQDKVKPLFETHGPLCDSEGFYNHFGECWIDVIQMMFLFSDTIKLEVQSYFVNQNINLDDVKQKVNLFLMYKEIFGTNDPSMKDIETYLSYLVEFLKAFQLRFLRHYYMEYARLQAFQKEEICTFEDFQGTMALEKILEASFLQRSRGREGFRSALFSQNYSTYKNKNRFKISPQKGYEPGSTATYIKILTFLLLSFFIRKDGIRLIHYEEDLFHRYFQHNYFSKQDNVFGYYLSSFGHLTCFYTCGDHTFFYDDNQGNLPFDWKTFMAFFKKTYISAYTKNTPLPVCYFTGRIIVYERKSYENFFEFTKFPVLEYEEEDGKHLYTNIFFGNNQYETLNFLVEPRGKEKDDYKWWHFTDKNAMNVRIDYDYYSKSPKVRSIYEFFNTLAEKNKKLTSKYNVQTGIYMGTRLNQNIQPNLIYKAKLEAFLKSLGKDEKQINKELVNQMTPLQTALYLRDKDSSKKILEFGADPSLEHKNKTPLQDAILFEEKDKETDLEKKKETTFQLVKVLVEAGADINHENHLKQTALWYAIYIGNLKVAKYLLEKGAIVQGKNIDNNKSPIDLIKEQIRNSKENVQKRSNLNNLLHTLKQKRESQEPFRKLITQLRQTRRR